MTVRRAGAAILAVDEFTGLPITGKEVRIRCRDGAVPIHKEDGYHVFWDNGEVLREFLIEVPGFLPEIIHINADTLRKKRLPTRSVYLIPSGAYPFPGGMKWKEYAAGPGAAGCVRELCWDKTEGILTLLKDAGPADKRAGELSLKAPYGMHMKDRIIYLKPFLGEAGDPEKCRLSEESSKEGVWLLEEPLSRDYKKVQTAVCLSYRTVADASGICRIPDAPSIGR